MNRLRVVANRSRLDILNRDTFHAVLRLERKRSDRSGRTFLLMLVDFRDVLGDDAGVGLFREAVSAFESSTRETDTVGWYEEPTVIGIIFTELGETAEHAGRVILDRVREHLAKKIGRAVLDRVTITLHVYPERAQPDNGSVDAKLYGDLLQRQKTRPAPLLFKRCFDVAFAAGLIAVLSPLMGAIAALIKLSSRGPVFFKQERIGQLGRPFTIFKFRSMTQGSSSRIHEEYIASFIHDTTEKSAQQSNGLFKLDRDPRITRLGAFLRRTSLDELPQLFNVIRGEMSLVGPRPPLQYELDRYDSWHRRRVLEAKPGITGLWQVKGRSRTTFDEMVRMDLRYIQNWSVWYDVKILMQTPWAVLRGKGAC